MKAGVTHTIRYLLNHPHVVLIYMTVVQISFINEVLRQFHVNNVIMIGWKRTDQTSQERDTKQGTQLQDIDTHALEDLLIGIVE